MEKKNSEEIEPLDGNGIIEQKYKDRWSRFQNDTHYKNKIIFSCCIVWMVFLQGWFKGQLGPALPDIQFITRTNLEQMSAFLTSFYVGKIAGCVLGGFIVDRFNINWTVTILYTVQASGMTLIPFISNHIAATTNFFVVGCINSILEIVIMTTTFRLYCSEKNTYVHATQLTLSISSIVSPLAMAPFLLPKKLSTLQMPTINADVHNDIISNFTTTGLYNSSTNITNFTTQSYYGLHSQNETSVLEVYESRLYIPFSIASAVMFFTALLFFLLQISGKELPSANRTVSIKQPTATLTKRYIFRIANVCLIGGYSSALETAMANLLSVFTLHYLGWPPVKGAFAISLFYFAYLFGKLLGVLLSRFFKSVAILGIYVTMSTMSFAGFLVSSYTYSSTGLWVSTACCGFAVSTLYTALMTWLFQTKESVSGKVTSVLLTTAYVGSMVISPILSFLMENISVICFSFVCVVTCVLMMLSFVMLVIFGTETDKVPVEEEIQISSKLQNGTTN